MATRSLFSSKTTRRKSAGLLTAVLVIVGPGLTVPGCGLLSLNGRFLGLQDYQRDFLFFAGNVAVSLLLNRGNNSNTDNGGDEGTSRPVPGQDGLNCWDVNGNGLPDPDEEDFNNDGVVDVFDCRDVGSSTDGQDGQDGQDGREGADGTDGLNCWDLNGNGDADPEEDVDGDGDFTAADCQGSAGAGGSGGQAGTPGINCWDLNENGIRDFAIEITAPGEHSELTEDINGDGYIDVLDCRSVDGTAGEDGADGQDGTDGLDGADGTDGLNCWDLNGNGVGDVDLEDANGDLVVDVNDCHGADGEDGLDGTDGQDGTDGLDGADGLHCWDLDGDGRASLKTEDVNDDGLVNVFDCHGMDGVDGVDGEDGFDGQDGVNCWDLNGNGVGDLETEDLNGDQAVDVRDCRGADGADGADGQDGEDGADGLDGADGADGVSCWDLNSDGVGQPNEDVNADGFFDAFDCRGAEGTDGIDGIDGEDGINCWDVNENGTADLPDEDTNGDGAVNVWDCRVDAGAGNEVFITDTVYDFYTLESGSYDSIPFNATGLPVVRLEEPSLGACGDSSVDVGAFRFAVPTFYDPGNPLTMRAFIWRSGPKDGCFTLQLDAFRSRHGVGIGRYGDTRFIVLDSPVDPDPTGTLLVVDLPLNTGDGDLTRGLGFTNDLVPADLLAFELNRPEGVQDGGCYTLIGVEFFEAAFADQVNVRNASVYTTLAETGCAAVCDGEITVTFETASAGNVVDSIFDENGCGPVGIFGFNQELDANAARIFDSSRPTGGDVDLGTPHEDFGGPGIGRGPGRSRGGGAESDYPNDLPLGNVLIIDEDLVGEPDDTGAMSGYLDLNFSALGGGTVRVTALDVMDIEPHQVSGRGAMDVPHYDDDEYPNELLAGPEEGGVAGGVGVRGVIEFFDPDNVLVATFDLPVTGDNGVAHMVFGDEAPAGVAWMRVRVGGSAAIDNVTVEVE